MAASTSSKKKNELLLFKQEKPHFFKIILQDSISQHKLEIPRKFVKFYGDNLSSSVTLKPPSGEIWQVEIVRSDGEIWLQNGWREFVEYYSIVHGSLLVFEYEKSTDSSEFNVMIFDQSATEIEYPIASFGNGDSSDQLRANLDQQQVPRDPIENNFELDETFATKKIASPNPSFQAKLSSARLKSGVVYVPMSFMKNVKQKGNAILKVNEKCWPVRLINYPELFKGQLSKGWLAFARDNSLKVGDVCTFQLIHSTDQSTLIDVSIIRDSDRETELEEVPEVEEPITKIPDEVVDQFSSSRKRKEKSPLSSLQSDKKMKIHEAGSSLQSENNPSFQIAMKKTNLGKSEQSMREESGAIGLEKPSVSNRPELNPFFQVTLTSSHFEGDSVNVPRRFIKHMEHGTRIAQLQVGSRFWSVNLIIYPHYTKSMFSGLRSFARANVLKVGDVCSFELIDAQNLVIKVSISRDNMYVSSHSKLFSG